MAMDSRISWQSSIPFSILGGLLFLYVLWLISRSRRNNSGMARKAPPEAGRAWPVIGHLHLLGGPDPAHVTLGNMADKYGPIFTIRLGVHRNLVVSSWDMAKECFTVNDRAFATRPKYLAFEVLGYNFSMIGFSLYGPYWRHVRKMATIELLSNHRLAKLEHVKESEVKAAMKETYDMWSKQKKINGSGAVTEMKKWFGDIALNVVFRMVVGKRFVGGDCENEANERTRKVLREFFDLSGSFAVSDALPYLRWLDLDGKEKAMKKIYKELDRLVQVWLEEHKRNRDSGQHQPKHDFMDVLLSIVDEAQVLDSRDADTTVKATSLAAYIEKKGLSGGNLQTLILAGTDTTTVTLTWAVSLLMNNREVLEKAVREVDTQIGRERLAVEADLKKLVYLEAIVKETMRLYPAAPLSVPHECMEDCSVGGYHIPSGTRLLTNLSKLHRDPGVYEDPLEFRPERFLTSHKGVEMRGQNFELIPFGAGRRMCPGASFALQIVQLTLANLLLGFDMVTPDNQPVDMSEQKSLTNMKATPLQLLLTPRLFPHVYG